MDNNQLETISDDMLDQVSGGGIISSTIELADNLVTGAVEAAGSVIGGGFSFLGGLFSRIGGWFR